jgi:hypothetical protein
MALSWQNSCSCLDAFPQSNGISCLPRRRRSKAYQRRADMCCRVIGQGCAGCDELDSLFAQLTRRVEIVRLSAGGRQSPTSSQVRGRRAAPAKSRHWVGRPRRLCDSASARRGRGEWPGWLSASNGWRQLGVKPRCPTAIWPALGGTCALDVGFPSLGLLASWGQWHGPGGFLGNRCSIARGDERNALGSHTESTFMPPHQIPAIRCRKLIHLQRTDCTRKEDAIIDSKLEMQNSCFFRRGGRPTARQDRALHLQWCEDFV